jgi:hypothetical protein
VTISERRATSSGTEKIIFDVRAFWSSSPLRRHPSSRSSGRESSSSVTTAGPIGPNPGNDFPME